MIPRRYNRRKFKKALKNPELFKRELNHLTNRAIDEAFELKYGGGLDVVSEDWDNLVILDACRYDIFEEVNFIDGKLRRVTSKGSQSEEFLRKNFKGRDLSDTVYITGNPKYHTVGIKNEFYDIVHSYNSESFKDSKWDNLIIAEQESPDSVYKSAVENLDKYYNKRKVIHFMQPHSPYHGSKAQEVRNRLTQEHGLVFSCFTEHNKIDDMDADNVYHSLLRTLPDGYITPQEMKEVYIENLEIVLEYVEELVDKLEGKTVITADHGELLGEPTESKLKKLLYNHSIEHPEEVYVPELRLVPWLTIPSDDRPDIISEEPVEKKEVDSDVVEDQLEALGYKT